jgi:hypothetical protein
LRMVIRVASKAKVELFATETVIVGADRVDVLTHRI